MKNLKKLLAVLLTVAMLATMVPAFAADEDAVYGDEAVTLNGLGLYNGTGNVGGEFVADLSKALDRETGVVILLRLLGVEAAANAMTDADVDAALAAFSDVSGLSSWAKKAMAYAVKMGLVKGTSTTTLSAKAPLTGNQFTTILLRAMGYAPDYNTGADTLVTKGGLTAEMAAEIATKELTRDDIVGIMYSALMAKYADGKTIADVLVAGGSLNADKAEDLGLVVPTVLKIKAAATGAKKLTVTFNMAIVDTTKAVISVKKLASNQGITSKTFAADTKSVVIELSSALEAADYVITVAGLSTTALTATVTAAAETFPTIVIPAKILQSYREGATGASSEGMAVGGSVIVQNQYGEDVTAAQQSNVIVTSSKGLPVGGGIGAGQGLAGIVFLTSNGSGWTKNLALSGKNLGETYIKYTAAGAAKYLYVNANQLDTILLSPGVTVNTAVNAYGQATSIYGLGNTEYPDSAQWYDVTNPNAYSGPLAALASLPVRVSAADITAQGLGSALPAKNFFVVGEKITVSYIHKVTGAFANAEFQVAAEPKITGVDLWVATLNEGVKADTFTITAGETKDYLLTGAFDASGQAITDDKILTQDLLVSNSNDAVLKIAGIIGTSTVVPDATTFVEGGTWRGVAYKYAALQIKAPAGGYTAGTSKVSVMSRTGGVLDTITITVVDSKKLDVVTLTAPTQVIAGKSVEIPYTAVNQFGEATTDITSANAANWTTPLATTAGALEYKTDYTGKRTLTLNLSKNPNQTDLVFAAATNVTITGTTKTGKIVTLVIAVQPNSAVTAITGATAMKKLQATTTTTVTEVKLIDQYGLAMDLPVGTGVYATSSNTAAVTVNGLTLTAVAKGTSTITLQAKTTNGTVNVGSELTFEVSVVAKADIVSYEAADLAKIYVAGGAGKGSMVVVTGKLADGSAVAVPESDYAVVVTSKLQYVAGEVYSESEPGAADVTETVIITVNGASSTTIIAKTIVVSMTAPSATVVASEPTVNADLNAVNNSEEIFEIVDANVKITDQYGKDMVTGDQSYTIIVTNTGDAAVSGVYLTNAVGNLGKSFDVTVVTSNQKTIKFKVIVTTNAS